MRDVRVMVPTGVEIGYRDWGGSGPPLVLAHGLGSSLHMWDYAAPLLAGHFHVVAYDQRGHASSSKPDRGYNLDTMVEDLRGLISGLGLEQPVVVGHSWGALIALAYAAQEGSRCPGVGLIDGGVIDIRGIPGLTWETMERDMNPPALSHLTLDDHVALLREGGLHHLPESFLREFVSSMREEQPDGTMSPRLGRAAQVSILRAIWETPVEDLLARVRCPMLVVLARQEDGSSTFMEARRRGAAMVERYAPHARIVWMENTLHDIPLHRPEQLAAIITSAFTTQD